MEGVLEFQNEGGNITNYVQGRKEKLDKAQRCSISHANWNCSKGNTDWPRNWDT